MIPVPILCIIQLNSAAERIIEPRARRPKSQSNVSKHIEGVFFLDPNSHGRRVGDPLTLLSSALQLKYDCKRINY